MGKRKKNRKSITQALNIPQDVTSGVAIMTVVGRNEIIIENYRGIIEYDDKRIKISTKSGNIELEGERFLIEYYTNDEMKIRGKILEIKMSSC